MSDTVSRLPSAPGALRRIVVVGVGLAYLALALLGGIDRISRNHAGMAAPVDWLYDNGGAAARAAALLDAGQPAAALAPARRALHADPLDARALSLLARVAFANHDTATATRAFAVSAGLGWREPSTQLFWLERSLGVDDLPRAARHLDGLLRQEPLTAGRDDWIDALVATEEGGNALAQRLRLGPNWADDLALPAHPLPRDALYARGLAMIAAGPGMVACQTASYLADRLVLADLVDVAHRVWQQNCNAEAALIADPDFRSFSLTAAQSTFGWRLPHRGDIDFSETDLADGRKIVAVANNGPVSIAVLRLFMPLPSAHYRLSWRMPDTDEPQSRRFYVSADCDPSLMSFDHGTPVARGSDLYTLDLQIDPGCDARYLNFWLAPRAHIRLTGLHMERVGDYVASPDDLPSRSRS